jgi:hypothetical protein
VMAAPVDPEISHALDSQPSLARMSLSRTVGMWRLVQPAALPPAPPGDPWHGRWLLAQALMVLLVSVLAAPGSRTENDEQAPQDKSEPVRELAAR